MSIVLDTLLIVRSSLLSVSPPFKHASLWVSSPTVTSVPMRPESVSPAPCYPPLSAPEQGSNVQRSIGFPITLLLIGMIYTGSKALQFLSIPVYTIFKNLTIILIAYGEVLWFGGSVTGMTLFSFGLMVVSSIIAAWADIKHALESSGDTSSQVSTLNAGYVWMMINCLCTSSYVLGMRKRIKLTNFKDFDSMFFFSIPLLSNKQI